MEQQTTFTLKELQGQIKEQLSESFSYPIWIVAEINTLTHHRSGHCYLELVQKSKRTNSIEAQARATIWSSKFLFINSFFESETGSELAAGMNVMLQVTVTYHEVYGLSLNVIGINPTYTIGDMERAKKEIIDRLIKEDLFDLNKALTFPSVIQNIAVVSSASAAGYGDFVNHIQTNIYGYNINITLFEAIMQGENTESSVLNALSAIDNEYKKFDAIAIIRGGGSKNDLSWFDNYNISAAVAQSKLPVISGIGHERDESIVDMVANTRMKTPTAVANFIIDYNAEYESHIDATANDIFMLAHDILVAKERQLDGLTMGILKVRKRLANELEKCNTIFSDIRLALNSKIKEENILLKQISEKIEREPKLVLSEKEKELANIKSSLATSIRHKLEKANEKINFLEYRVTLNDPKTILKRGYSISKVNGKVVTSNSEIHEGDILETVLYDGSVRSVVKK